MDYSLSTRVELWTKAEEDGWVQMERKHMMMGKGAAGKVSMEHSDDNNPPLKQKTKG